MGYKSFISNQPGISRLYKDWKNNDYLWVIISTWCSLIKVNYIELDFNSYYNFHWKFLFPNLTELSLEEQRKLIWDQCFHLEICFPNFTCVLWAEKAAAGKCSSTANPAWWAINRPAVVRSAPAADHIQSELLLISW